MDPVVIGSIITAIGSLTAAATTGYFLYRTKKPISSVETASDNNIVDISGTWVASEGELYDEIRIISQDGRLVNGERVYRGKDGTQRKYLVSGYFDGMILAVAATCSDKRETRTLALVLKRLTSAKFSGVRSYMSGQDIRSTKLYEWLKRDDAS